MTYNISWMPLDGQVDAVVEYLWSCHRGADVQTTNAVLSKRFEMPDCGKAGRQGILNSRRMTKILNRARELGYPVVADNKGIYYAKFREEADGMIADYANRARVYGRQARLLKKAAERLPTRDNQPGAF
jgi:hypothetical protein